MGSEEKRYALLIDSDNVSAKYIDTIFDELADRGMVTVRRIYGDWARSVNGWNRATLLRNSIVPIQQFAYTQGKNATDSAMIIDAMDITGGKGIMLGQSNFLARAYQGAPIAITVEGANILTRSMMIFGQGAIRCHPYVLEEMEAAKNNDVNAFDRSRR